MSNIPVGGGILAIIDEARLKTALQAAMEDYKRTPAYVRNCDWSKDFQCISLSDMTTDLAPLLLKRLQ